MEIGGSKSCNAKHYQTDHNGFSAGILHAFLGSCLLRRWDTGGLLIFGLESNRPHKPDIQVVQSIIVA